MKKILGVVLVFLCLVISSQYLFGWGGQQVTIRPVKYTAIYSVSCSSLTSTEIRPKYEMRQGILIYNPSSNYTVYLSTYATTSGDNLFPIPALKSFSDTIAVYTGAWYAIMESGATDVVIKIIEK